MYVAVVTGVCICGYASLVESSIAEAKSKIKELEVLCDCFMNAHKLHSCYQAVVMSVCKTERRKRSGYLRLAINLLHFLPTASPVFRESSRCSP